MKTLKQEVLHEFSYLNTIIIEDLKKKIDFLNKENNILKTNLIDKEIIIKNLNKHFIKN